MPQANHPMIAQFFQDCPTIEDSQILPLCKFPSDSKALYNAERRTAGIIEAM